MSGSYIDTPGATFTAGEAIEQYRRVYLSAERTVSKAGASDEAAIGIARSPVASGGIAEVILFNKEGTFPMVASAAITANAKVYAAASGKISSTPSGKFLGWALEAASGDGSVIEVLKIDAASLLASPFDLVVAKTTDYPVVAADHGKTFVTTGAGGTVIFTLPAPAASLVGMRVKFRNVVDQTMKVAGASADQLITFNDLDADDVSFAQASEKIGGGFDALCVSSTKWLIEIFAEETQTVAVTT